MKIAEAVGKTHDEKRARERAGKRFANWLVEQSPEYVNDLQEGLYKELWCALLVAMYRSRKAAGRDDDDDDDNDLLELLDQFQTATMIAGMQAMDKSHKSDRRKRRVTA